MTALWGAGWLAYHQADDTAAEASALAREELARQHGDARARRNGITIRGMVVISNRAAELEALPKIERAAQGEPVGFWHVYQDGRIKRMWP